MRTIGRQETNIWLRIGLWFSLACCLGISSAVTLPPLAAQTPDIAGSVALSEWKQRQAAVQEVVERTTNAVVAVTDGESFGSGVVVSRDGLVLTAGHVIMSEMSEFTVLFPDGRSASAKPLGKNLDQDAGMMQITDQGDWPYVDLADGLGIRRGEWVVALGHSGGWDLGRRPPVRVGRVLRVERDALTTDSPIIGGDSGGPLFDLEGQLIGIHSSIGESIAENRHVSIRTFLRDWDRLEAGESWGTLPGTRPPRARGGDRDGGSGERGSGRGSRRNNSDGSRNSGDSGSSGRPPGQGSDPPAAERESETAALGVEVDRSDRLAVLRDIKPNSAAARVGLRVGDVVESVNGVPVNSPADLVAMIASKRVGDRVKLLVRRGGQQLEYQIVLGQLETR
jgi:serine protease Do